MRNGGSKTLVNGKAMARHALMALTLLALLAGIRPARADVIPVTFGAGADDYIALTIDGTLVCTYDSYPAGGASGILNMTPGTWYDISIDYKNRWGTDGMSLTWDQPDGESSAGGAVYGGTGTQPYVVPASALRSYDQSGHLINGLTGTYYDLSGNYLTTVYGEVNGSSNQTLGTFLGNEAYWSTFEERMTGQIMLPVPEPHTLFALMGGLGSVLVFRRRR
jgi:hypothetical protein